MPQVNPTTYHESSSSISAFQKCNVLFRLAYREGLRPAADTDSQRQGNIWHKMHETYANALAEWSQLNGAVEVTSAVATPNPTIASEFALTAVLEVLNQRYTHGEKPNYMTIEEWSLERQIMLTSFIGYLWYYQNDPVSFLASELPFNLPMHMPRTGLPLPMNEVQRVGKIDHIIRWQSMVGVLERKSTTRSIEEGSDYWDRAKKDTQVSMYAAALRDLAASDPTMMQTMGVKEGETYGNTLYDVWHKPTIKPKMLTQADTAAFLHSGQAEAEREYHGQSFTVKLVTKQDDSPDGIARYTVDGETYEIEPGKKGYAMRETIGMFGARLLADIYERPTFYFVRREIPRTDADIKAFRAKAYSIYQTKKLIEKHGTWFENESACRATFPCPYIPICYGPGHAAVCDGQTTPNGFKRIFVDLTVKGNLIEEE